MQKTPADRKRQYLAFEIRLIEGAKARHVRSAKWLISRLVTELKSGAELSEPARAFLADSLENAAENPKRAGVALGLVPRKARPEINSLGRAVQIGRFLERRQKEGLPLKSSRADLNGAFTQAAAKFHMSESGVERAWAIYRENMKQFEQTWNDLEKQGYFK